MATTFVVDEAPKVGDKVEYKGRIGWIESKHLFGGYKVRFGGLVTERCFPEELTKVVS